jgi:uncharacterized membrane protein YvbJ
MTKKVGFSVFSKCGTQNAEDKRNHASCGVAATSKKERLRHSYFMFV